MQPHFIPLERPSADGEDGWVVSDVFEVRLRRVFKKIIFHGPEGPSSLVPAVWCAQEVSGEMSALLRRVFQKWQDWWE